MFWLAPLWLLTMLPMADVLARRRWTRGLALVLLALSVLSASYPTWNPWTHPWLMNLSQYLGWGHDSLFREPTSLSGMASSTIVECIVSQ